MGTFVPFAHFLGGHLDRWEQKMVQATLTEPATGVGEPSVSGVSWAAVSAGSRSLAGPYIGPVVLRDWTWIGCCFPLGKFGRFDNDIQNRHGTLFHRDRDVFVGHRGLPCGAAPNKMDRGSYG